MPNNNFECNSALNCNTIYNLLRKKGRLKIHHLNSQRIARLRKFDDLVEYINSYTFDFDVISLVETWFTSNETGEVPSTTHAMNLYQIEEYNSEYCSRSTRSAGLAIYLKKSIKYEVLEKSNGDISFMILKIEGNHVNEDLIFMSIYMPKLSDFPQLLHTLESKLRKYGNSKCIITGDFNVNVKADTQFQLAYCNLLASYDFQVINDKITRPSSGTIIDHVVTNIENSTIFTVKNEISDHNSLISLHEVYPGRSKTHLMEKVRIDYNKLTETLQNAFCDPEMINDLDADQAIEFVMEKISDSVDQCKTIKRFKVKERNKEKPFVDRQIVLMNNARKKQLNELKRQPNNSRIKEKIRRFNELISQRKETLTEQFIKNKFNCAANSKEKWRELNKLLGRRKASTVIHRMENRKKDEILASERDIANELNQYFSTIGASTNDTIPHVSSNTNPSNTNTTNHRRVSPVNSMALHATTQHEVLIELKELAVNKATGLDQITNRILKNNAQSIAAILAICINKSFEMHVYPRILKRAKVIPIFKGGHKHSLQNYRPISILSGINKIYERLINARMWKFLIRTGFITKHQYGFRGKSNTTIAAVELMEYIYNNLDKKEVRVVSGMSIDLRKAFDTVNHAKLLKICEEIGIRGQALKLLRSYLTDRKQVTTLGKQTSESSDVLSGVPQGSILGPTLFLIYINSLADLNLFGRLFLYADDAFLLYAANDDSLTCTMMNHDLKMLEDHLKAKHLSINRDKTKYIHFRSCSVRLNADVPVKLGDEEIEQVQSITYLGLTIDANLTFKKHVSGLCKTLRSVNGVIYRLRKRVNEKQLWDIYNAFFNSHLNYMIEIWGWASRSTLKPIQILQNRALKTILNLPLRTPSIDLFEIHCKRVLPVNGIFTLKVCKLLRKFISSEVHHTLTIDSYEPPRVLRNTSNYRIQNVHTGIGGRQLVHGGLRMFLKLPLETREFVGSDMAATERIKRELRSQVSLRRFLET